MTVSAAQQIHGQMLMSREPILNVNEMFSNVWQGEGPATGEWCMFLRLANCNLSCGKGPGATWHCDTPYTWDWERHDRKAEVHPMGVREVAADLSDALGDTIRTLIISGGEPLLQKMALDELLDLLPDWVDVDIETNGTRPPLDHPIRRYVVSPKLANSGMREKDRIKPRELTALQLAGDLLTAFKFVATIPQDLDEVDALVDAYDLMNVWIMPSGTTAKEIMGHARLLAPAVAERGYNLTLRQHVLLYGDERGT